MLAKNRDYSNKTFKFKCKNCREMREFVFEKLQATRKVILRCKGCGCLISKRRKYIDQQME